MLKFGFNTVVSGQKVTPNTNEPVLIANSTKGKFTVSPVVTKIMAIAQGDNIQFINNLDDIDRAIVVAMPELVEAVQEQGLEWGTEEATAYIYGKYGVWGIIKGIALKDRKGMAVKSAIRMEADEKVRYFNENREAELARLQDTLVRRAIDKGIIATAEEATAEVLESVIDLKDIKAETDAFSGSKTAATSKMKGIGLQLNFTDASIWNMLKADLEEPEKVNRKFKVDIENPVDMVVNNGFEDITVQAYTFTKEADETPSRVGSKEA